MKKQDLKKIIKQIVSEQIGSGEVLPNVSQAGSGNVVISCPDGYHFKSDFHDILTGGPNAPSNYLIHRVAPCEPDKTITKFPRRR